MRRSAPHSWGETDMSGLQRGDMPKFDATSDIASPIFGGAVAELKNGARLVLITSPRFAYNSTLDEPDPELARRRILASRFPGQQRTVQQQHVLAGENGVDDRDLAGLDERVRACSR
jgi:hypothetical protein